MFPASRRVPIGMPALSIERRSSLADGRSLEQMRSQYRGDAYDVTAELSLFDTKHLHPAPAAPSPPPLSRSA
jgi:hypothetical protein